MSDPILRHAVRFALTGATVCSFMLLAEQPRPLQDPPLLEIKRAILPLLTKAQQQAGAPQPDEASLDWNVMLTRSQLWNPTTSSWDQVNLRSYQGSKVDPKAPFVAPTLRVFPGETIRATLHNKLDPDPSCISHSQGVNDPHCFNGTNMHTHGLWINPAGNSDNVLISINPGVSFQYEYNIPADHPAGTFWYHPHRHGSTAIQVASGMAGALIIQGTRQPTKSRTGDIDLLLTSSANQSFKERTMVFQQIQYGCYTKTPGQKPVLKTDANGAYICDPGDVGEILNYDGFGPGGWSKSGRYTSINGAVQPFFADAKAGQIERWRMVHAGVRDSINLKVVKLTGSPLQGQVSAADEQKLLQKSCTGALVPQHQIAADGLTLAEIDSTEVTVLQPGYRWDTLMMFPEGGQYCVIDDAAAASANVDQTPSQPQLLGIVQVEAVSGPVTSTIGQQLIQSAKINISPDMQSAVITDLQAGLKLSNFVPHQDLPETENKQLLEFNIDTNTDPIRFEINGEPYQPGRIDRELILGNIDEWILTSKLASHPFHIHVNPFQVVAVLDPNGKDVSAEDAVDDFDTSKKFPDPQYRGMKGKWKDTLWIKNAMGKSYKVIVRTKYQRYIGDFVLHCHILDHEDQGMMQNVRISLPDGSGGASKGHH
ncbi:multicopper oxidase family protein [Rheinheimera soli]|uniref:FtsP/CotA-like multicopper oxidase with cupredoxin domain n=1 Tax=Rheinheimera soli TaxID=443616 RepID=A0ABU1W410_9GAMM|nr:multicopper oxidase family protein [Rheinheimera soli]MDR7122565.1 FtsP/CotA-like multicopper oxidase with cupredoxin domain [Rheinheimera soli]